ncbi:hypothetical protein GKZ90_0005470 [Flavobacterium sp. MC2016-06]|uniref:hypothetical protein n=1 Tax=Flavobacterium sp. MC2016-06 TaxID=2676308 RepID=UPI0012BAF08C|nr:hypothetical protein [Flavobacterium sp. MC2016-06]MBU3857586.1 hypothetical protein [Flavobacterium sp. MC2016-06]
MDQNSALNSRNESLVPSPYLIDGRDEQDWLYFLTEFSKLINFYNDTNTIDGNWNPFLLKDPVFLMVSISKTNYKNLHSIYKNSCTEIQNLLQKQIDGNLTSIALNKLFDHITSIYKIIERWTHYMQSSNEIYDLKNYIIHEVKTKLSVDFWAIQSFRQYLNNLSAKGIFTANMPNNDFTSFNTDIWSINKDKSPFWEVFGFETEKTVLDAASKMTSFSLNILTIIADHLFHFLETIIHHSTNEFKKLSHKKSKFPDTTLLRSFVNTLKVQQDHLNGISQKHLDFYYTDILKQTKLPAVADHAFLCAVLAKTDSVFNLPSGTLFNAGVDAQADPILFASQKDVVLNPASITSVQTLAYQKQPNSCSYNLQTISKPSSIQKDEAGNTISWPTFGDETPATTPLSTGFAFASPMLLLREGQRTITLTFEFSAAIDSSVLQGADFFLSTQKSWLKLTAPAFPLNTPQVPNAITVVFNLTPADLPIEPFLINPDGVKTEWPMLKIVFETIADSSASQQITSITINTAVKGAQTFQLYNDFGELNAKNPFPPFGPTPLLNSNFIIGNNEIFSKPLDNFLVTIDWDKLPSDFMTYYTAYNTYLVTPSSNNTKSDTSLFSFLKKNDNPVTTIPETFNNANFKANFNILQEKSWTGLQITKVDQPKTDPTSVSFVSIEENTNPVDLFNPANGDPKIPFVSNLSSYYSYYKLKTDSQNTADAVKTNDTDSTDKALELLDPSIQNQPLKFTDTSTSGFIKMVLASPEYGFGSELYPNVVTSIAFKNGNIFNKSRGKDVSSQIIPPASVPFAPKIKTISADYTANIVYKLDGTAGHYPLQFFLYSPFKNYSIFDSTAIQTSTALTNTAIVGLPQTDLKNGFPIYPTFDYTGALFLELDNLICNSSLNLYFELARNSTVITSYDSVQYFYLNNLGWNEVKILSDETNQFKCSGIIELAIPLDCNNNQDYMPGTNNWLAIAVCGELDTYSKTTFLQTNGFSVQRTGTSFLTDTQVPQINANVITKPQTAIPQIASLLQPFPSFGGKAAENKTNKNERVSTTIKTKNRVVSPADYYTLIAQNFDAVYYSKVVTKQSNNSCNVYLIKKTTTDNSNAFMPLVTNCLEIEIQDFLTQNASPFANINVSNFNLEYVTINAVIGLKSGYQETLVLKTINLALKEYLSPWITNCTPQIEIGQPLLDAKINSFILTIEGVETVQDISFSSYYINSVTKIQTVCKKDKTKLQAYGASSLLVTAPNHNITFLA